MNCCDNTIYPQLSFPDAIPNPTGIATENVSQLGYMIGSGEPVLIEVIRLEGGGVLKYVGHRANGLAPIDPILTSQFTWEAPSTKFDAEVVCLSNDGGATIVRGVVVYDLSVMPPTESYYIGGVLVSGYTQENCGSATVDYEQVSYCYQLIADPNQKYNRIDFVEAGVTPLVVSTLWFDVIAQTYVSQPIDIQQCTEVNTVTNSIEHYVIPSGGWFPLLPYDYKSISISPDRTTSLSHSFQNVSTMSGIMLLERDLHLTDEQGRVPDLYIIYAGDAPINLTLQ